MAGLLVLMGGNEFRPDCVPMDRDLLERIGRTPARVAILPTAAAHQNPRLAADNGIRYFASLGASASPVMVLTRADANESARLLPIREADLIYFTGGDPRHLLSVFVGSVAWALIGQRWQVGATMVGSSAGAMALAGMMVHGGPPVEALGAAPRVVVLPHYNAAEESASQAVSGAGLPPGLTVFGIPTATGAATTDGSVWEALGTSSMVISPPDPEPPFTVEPGDRFWLA